MIEPFLPTGHKGEQELKLYKVESIRIRLAAHEKKFVMLFSDYFRF
jgi:hypothetical protein